MHILNTLEREAFDSPPMFTSLQRRQHFDFPVALLQVAGSFRTPANQVCFLVSCGYFEATKQFFPSRTFHARDVAYVAQQLGLVATAVDPSAYDKETLRRHRDLVRHFYGFRTYDQEAGHMITREIDAMVRSQLSPKRLLLRTIEILIREKIEVPGYYPLAELILAAINTWKQVLAARVEEALPATMQAMLDALLVQSPVRPGEAAPSKTAAYRLTLLKKLSQSTKPSKVKESVADLHLVQELYRDLQPVLEALDLPPEGIRYYAQSVLKSEIFQVTRRADADRYLHLIAFIVHQYYRLQDTLVDILLHAVQTYVNTVRRIHKDLCYERRARRTQDIKALVSYLDGPLVSVLSTIQAIAESPQWDDTEKIAHIRALLTEQEPVRQEAEACLAPVKQELERALTEEDYHKILEARSIRIQHRATPIIKALAWQGEAGTEALLQAIQYVKTHEGTIDSAAPLRFLTPVEQEAVMGGGRTVRVSLYKAFLFMKVLEAIKSGTLNLEHCYKFRALDTYLIEPRRWQREKAALLARAGLESSVDVQSVLETLDHALHDQYLATNQHLQDGHNPWVTCAPDGTLRISTPKPEAQEVEPLQMFFPARQDVSLLEVLATVNRYSGFLKEFPHWQQRYHRGSPSPKTFFAGIIGLGCGIGIRKMARISRQIHEAELEYTVNWFFTPESLHAANDKVLQLIDQLELPNVYRRSQDTLHTSSDGQKFAVRVESLNATHSFKYFGHEKGVSVYSFIDERHLLFHSTVISASERESAYVIDGLMHNDVIRSDIHSTDTHGFSEAIFGTMHLLGFSFAPRIKQLKHQRLYIFPNRRAYDRSQWQAVPAGYIDTAVIVTNWDDILRFMVTIQLKEATASDLFRRLNSYAKQHPLYRALKAFGRILKSLFILRYIDDLNLRQAIEKQLNKIESAHRFARAISVGNPREFLEADKQEQEIAEGCKRLIQNAITCWNYLYLSQKLAEADASASRETLLQAIAGGSVVSWQHINLLGEYDFSDERLQDSVGIKLPSNLTGEPLPHVADQSGQLSLFAMI